MEEENKINNEPLFKLGNLTDRRDAKLNLTDRENNLDKSHLTQNPEDALFPQTNNNSHYNIKRTDTKISLETFRTMFKNKHRELNEYKENLNKKIELLKKKIFNSKINNKEIIINDIKKNDNNINMI